MILSIDIGTTHLKAGLFDERAVLIGSAHRPNTSRTWPDGTPYYDPDELWERVAALIRHLSPAGGAGRIEAVGITGMAESGLLVDAAAGKPRTCIVPWFDRSSLEQAVRIEREVNAKERFRATGLRPSFKCGLSKLLRLQDRQPDAFRGAVVWLSASAYIAYRLTGAMAEEYSLAARTYAFRIADKRWDAPLIRHFGLRETLFPTVLPAAVPTGRVRSDVAAVLGLPAGTAVFQAGHDHVCASLAVGAVHDGDVYNSMGTAETMTGAFPARSLTDADWASGLSFGLHPVPRLMFWMGGHSASGGSVEWLRELLADEEPGYDRMMRLLDAASPEASGIVYLPYLSGSGAPDPDPEAKAAFVGLTERHGRSDLIKAVLEGNAYQMEAIRRCAESATGTPIRRLRVVGGGARNRHWLQIKADVSGTALEVPGIPEAALAGAAITALVGLGRYASYEDAVASFQVATLQGRSGRQVIMPQPERSRIYGELYERHFVRLRRLLASSSE